MTRREFLSLAALGAAGLAQRIAPGGEPRKRPNVLWICVEDMSASLELTSPKVAMTRSNASRVVALSMTLAWALAMSWFGSA